MARIKSINFSHTDRIHGCMCDRCGQWLQNIWTVEFSSGDTINFGIDCFNKMTQGKLTDYGKKLLKKSLDRLKKWQTELKKWQDGEYTAENCESYQFEQQFPDHYFYGKSFDEYKEFQITQWIPARIECARKDIEKFSRIEFTL